MSNLELVTTIISILLTVVGTVLGYFAKKNDKAKKYYETFIEVESKIKELCIAAETIYTKGEQKKKYVVASIHAFLDEKKIHIENDKIESIIESFIDITKKIN